MDFEEACYIFNLDGGNGLSGCAKISINKTDLKKKYHKLALQYHPDKHQNSAESTAYFQKIGQAYDILNGEDIITQLEDYSYYFNMFFKEDNTVISTFLSFINFETLTAKIFENIDKHVALEMYNYFFQHRAILHISENWIDSLKKIIIEKYSNVHIYILEPSLSDIFGDRIYVLGVNEKHFFVPLWHSELEFEDDSDIIVKCVPKLPKHISIDENNNILVNIIIVLTASLFEEEYITINLNLNEHEADADNIDIQIPVAKLFIKKQQYYVLKGKGILRIREKDIYNSDERSDIIVNIQMK